MVKPITPVEICWDKFGKPTWANATTTDASILGFTTRDVLHQSTLDVPSESVGPFNSIS